MAGGRRRRPPLRRKGEFFLPPRGTPTVPRSVRSQHPSPDPRLFRSIGRSSHGVTRARGQLRGGGGGVVFTDSGAGGGGAPQRQAVICQPVDVRFVSN